MTTSARFLVGSLIASTVALTSCGTGTKTTTTVPSSTAPPTESDRSPKGEEVDANVALSCVDHSDPPTSHSANLRLNSVYNCMYHQDEKRLTLEFRRLGEMDLDNLLSRVQNFTGVKDYTTGAGGGDMDTMVELRGQNTDKTEGGFFGGSSAGETGNSCPPSPCTISITASEVTTPATLNGAGRLAGSITCPTVRTAAKGCFVCQLAPPKITFDIAKCTHS